MPTSRRAALRRRNGQDRSLQYRRGGLLRFAPSGQTGASRHFRSAKALGVAALPYSGVLIRQNAAIIGRVDEIQSPNCGGAVVMRTEIGGGRLVDSLSGEGLPRIC